MYTFKNIAVIKRTDNPKNKTLETDEISIVFYFKNRSMFFKLCRGTDQFSFYLKEAPNPIKNQVQISSSRNQEILRFNNYLTKIETFLIARN